MSYRRICFPISDHFSLVHYQQCLIFLMTQKLDGESILIELPENRYIEFLDRLRLWRVTSNVPAIFRVSNCVLQNKFQKLSV